MDGSYPSILSILVFGGGLDCKPGDVPLVSYGISKGISVVSDNSGRHYLQVPVFWAEGGHNCGTGWSPNPGC